MKSNGEHKSTSHAEMFFHVKREASFNGKKVKGGTVFCRQEPSMLAPGSSVWYASVSWCSVNDNWCRSTGRNVARRRYFASSSQRAKLGTSKPNFQLAESVFLSRP
jgi:hypothetical protein